MFAELGLMRAAASFASRAFKDARERSKAEAAYEWAAELTIADAEKIFPAGSRNWKAVAHLLHSRQTAIDLARRLREPGASPNLTLMVDQFPVASIFFGHLVARLLDVVPGDQFVLAQLTAEGSALVVQNLREFEERLTTRLDLIHAPPNTAGTISDSLSEWIGELQAGTTEQWWVKDGMPSTNTLPVMDAAYQREFRRSFPGPRAEVVLQARIRRAVAAGQRLDTVDYRYIVPRAALNRYMLCGKPNYDEYEALSPLWRASVPERRQRIENFIKYLESDKFLLALSDELSFSVWWGTYDRRVLLVEQCIGRTEDGLCFRVVNPNVVERYRAMHQRMWDELPDDAKDKTRIVGWLRETMAGVEG